MESSYFNHLKCTLKGKEESCWLDWRGKEESAALLVKSENLTLAPIKDKSVSFYSTKNMFIVGDNLQALKVIRRSLKESVKLIYIDPPYNTGSQLTYNDNRRDWLSFMYPRLQVTRDLLREDGCIFVSCDEAELASFILILDEVYGRQSRVGVFAVKTSNQTEGRNKLKNLDFLLCYAKSNKKFKFILPEKDQSARCTTGKLSQTQPEIEFPAGVECAGVEDGVYYQPESTGGNEDVHVVKGRIVVRDGRLAESVILKARWSNPNDIKKYIRRMLDGGSYPIYNKFGKELKRLWFKGKRFQPQMDKVGYELPDSFWTEFTGKGSLVLDSLVGKNCFSYPKHPDLIKKVISLTCSSEDTVLDFFGGSGTTAHAVMDYSVETGHDLRHITIQIDEACNFKSPYEYISDLAIDRIRKVGDSIVEKDGILNVGLRVFKVTHPLNSYGDDYVLTQALLEACLDVGTSFSERVIGGEKLIVANDNSIICHFGDNLGSDFINFLDEEKPRYLLAKKCYQSLFNKFTAVDVKCSFPESYSLLTRA